MADYMDPSYLRRRARQIVSEVLADHALREAFHRIEERQAIADLAQARRNADREAALEPFRAYGRACALLIESFSQITNAFAQGAAEVRGRQ